VVILVSYRFFYFSSYNNVAGRIPYYFLNNATLLNTLYRNSRGNMPV
jgi:hypothetical protein